MTPAPRNPRVDASIGALREWQQSVFREVREGESAKVAALLAIFNQIIANNRTGGWRRLKGDN